HSENYTPSLHDALPILKKIFNVRNPQSKGRDEIAEIYDNWKSVQGIGTPYNTFVTVNGEPYQQYYISEVRYNNHLPESLFTLSADRKSTRLNSSHVKIS